MRRRRGGICIIRSHNKNVINGKKPTNVNCNCRNKSVCIASTSVNPDKVYLGIAEGESKKRYYNRNKSFRHCSYANETTLSKYVWGIKVKYNEMPSLKWSVLKSVPGDSNILKRCLLCLHENFEIVNYPNQEELLNKRSKLISKCHHANKYLLENHKSND